MARIVTPEGDPENCMLNKIWNCKADNKSILNTSYNKPLPYDGFYVSIKHGSQQYYAATEIEDVK